MPRYRYTGESARTSLPDADGRPWFPSAGDEFDSDTEIDHPEVELIGAGEDRPHRFGYKFEPVVEDTEETAVAEAPEDSRSDS